jgi:hypothetical protein
MTKAVGVGDPLKEAVPSEVHALVETAHAQRSALASFIATDRDHGAGRSDAVAGSEFLDDRIRLRE